MLWKYDHVVTAGVGRTWNNSSKFFAVTTYVVDIIRSDENMCLGRKNVFVKTNRRHFLHEKMCKIIKCLHKKTRKITLKIALSIKVRLWVVGSSPHTLDPIISFGLKSEFVISHRPKDCGRRVQASRSTGASLRPWQRPSSGLRRAKTSRRDRSRPSRDAGLVWQVAREGRWGNCGSPTPRTLKCRATTPPLACPKPEKSSKTA